MEKIDWEISNPSTELPTSHLLLQDAHLDLVDTSFKNPNHIS